jgi:cytoskeletal protein CcmA (bactofilin family)
MSAAEGGSASIGKSVEIRGEVKGSEDLTVDGQVEGTITLIDSRLTIGPTARVHADVSARDVIILGTVNGNVTAGVRIELRKGANVTGDIRSTRLSIEEGSLFCGKVDLIVPGSTPAKNSANSPVVGVSGAAPEAGATGGLFSPAPKP